MTVITVTTVIVVITGITVIPVISSRIGCGDAFGSVLDFEI